MTTITLGAGLSKGTLAQQVINVMLDGKERHYIDIAKAIGVHYNSVNSTLTTLTKQGKLQRIKACTYIMPEKWATNKAAVRHA